MNKRKQHWWGMIALAVMLVAGCGDGRTPRPTNVSTLLEYSEAWQGEQVAVQGRVRSEHAPSNYWLEDGDQQRIAIHPPQRIGAYLGRDVRITGRFEYRVGGRRFIEIHEVIALDNPSPDK